jgi:excisionase family DNA binding protein
MSARQDPRARLCALLSRLSERQVELLLDIAEEFPPPRDAGSATVAPAQQVSAAASPVPPPIAAAAEATGDTAIGRPTYTVREAARLLGMKESALRERIRMRRVSVLRVGQRVLIKSEELERLLAERKAAHAAERGTA